MTLTNDDAFNAFKAKVDADQEKSQNRGSFTPREYEEIEYAAFSDNQNTKIVRLVGAPPQTLKGDSDAVEFHFAKCKADDGSRIQLRLPVRADDAAHDHIMWQIIDRVTKTEYKDKEKHFVYADYPWFEKVTKAGFTENDFNDYKWTKGWKGQKLIAINCIDRSDSWCADNKHTKVLSKHVAISNKDGKEYKFYDNGVPSYGFITKLSTMIGQYGSWENYDLQIRKTGEMTNPFEIKNASAFKKAGLLSELDQSLTSSIVEGPLTEEELGYTRYNLKNLYRPTSYSKLLKAFGNTIKAIDADLRTNFYDSLKTYADKEKEEMQALSESNNETAALTTTASVQESTAEVQRPIINRETNEQPAAGNLSQEKIAALKGWDSLKESEKQAITDVVLNADGSLKEVIYDDAAGALVGCPTDEGGCGFKSPKTFCSCPVCGVSFV